MNRTGVTAEIPRPQPAGSALQVATGAEGRASASGRIAALSDQAPRFGPSGLEAASTSPCRASGYLCASGTRQEPRCAGDNFAPGRSHLSRPQHPVVGQALEIRLRRRRRGEELDGDVIRVLDVEVRPEL